VNPAPYVLSRKGGLWGERHWNDLQVRFSVEFIEEWVWCGGRESGGRVTMRRHPHTATVPPHMSTAMTGISLAAPHSFEEVIGAMKEV
jgi:hypothetical protein